MPRFAPMAQQLLPRRLRRAIDCSRELFRLFALVEGEGRNGGAELSFGD